MNFHEYYGDLWDRDDKNISMWIFKMERWKIKRKLRDRTGSTEASPHIIACPVDILVYPSDMHDNSALFRETINCKQLLMQPIISILSWFNRIHNFEAIYLFFYYNYATFKNSWWVSQST